MLIRSLHRHPLTSIICYSFELQRQPVQRYFNKNFKVAREQIQKIGTEFSMSREQSRRLFHFYPKVFKPEAKQFQEFKERVKWVKELSNTDGKNIGKILEKFMFQSNHLAFKMDKDHFEKVVKAIRDNFESEAQIETIFSKCPNLINPKLPEILREKVSLLEDYLNISKQDAMKIYEVNPFLLASSARKIKESILIMNGRYGLSKPEVVEHMKVLGQVYLFGRDNLTNIIKIPLKWGFTQQEIKQIFLKNPLLFFNEPVDVMPYKRKIIRYLNFTTEMGKIMLKQYPQILIWSIRSFEEKALFITNRLEIKLDVATIQLLTLNFNKTLRPRGEIMRKTRFNYDNTNIVDLMKLTDQEFAKKLDVPLEKLKEEVAKYPISIEMDFKKSRLYERIGLKEKLLKFAEVYPH